MSVTIRKKYSGGLECPNCEVGTLVKTGMKTATSDGDFRKCNDCGAKFYVVKEQDDKYKGTVVG